MLETSFVGYRYTGSRLQRVRLQRAPGYNEQISLYENRWQQMFNEQFSLHLLTRCKPDSVCILFIIGKTQTTRMHSSRMRTDRLLTVSQHALLRGVYLPGEVPVQGVYLPGGCTCPGVYLPGEVYLLGVPGQVLPLWTEWQTGAKILPCPKLRLRAVIMKLDIDFWTPYLLRCHRIAVCPLVFFLKFYFNFKL